MKVCFIQPPSSLLLEDKVMPPLGILYLAAWLRKHGHEPSIIDLAGVDNWVAAMKRERRKLEDAAWVGITSTTPQYGVSRQICAYIKAVHRGKPVVIGGIHTTSLVHAKEMDFLQRDGFDGYCIGEGYNAVTKICEDLKQEARLRPLYSEALLPDVNSLPFAARDLIDIKSYKYKLGDCSATTFYSQYGCPYACLSADTLISLPMYRKARLETIRTGDYVINTMGQKSVVIASQRTPMKKQSYEVELESGEKIIGSAEHPVLTKRGWIAISKLRETDEVLTDAEHVTTGLRQGLGLRTISIGTVQ